MIIFGKIQSPCLGRDTLAGIVFEFPALAVQSLQPLFGTEDLVLSNVRAVDAVGAGAFYFFPKQHGRALRESGDYIIHQMLQDFHWFFVFFEGYRSEAAEVRLLVTRYSAQQPH